MYIYVYSSTWVAPSSLGGSNHASKHCLGDPREVFPRCAPLRCLRVQGSGLRVQGSGFRVQGSGFRVQGSGFRVHGERICIQLMAADLI